MAEPSLPSASAGKPTRTDVMRWLALLGLSIPIYATITLSPILNGAAMDHLKIDAFAIGSIRTLEILANAALTIALAPRLIRFEAKRLGVIGTLLVIASAIGSAFAGNYAALLIARLAGGLGGGLVQCALAVLIAETRSPQRIGGSLMIPITSCAVATALIGGRFTESQGQFGVFIVLAGAGLVGLALAYLSPRSPLSARKVSAGAADRSGTSLGALRSPYVFAAAIVFVGSTASWAFFERKGRSLGLAPSDISNLIAIASLSAGILASLSVFIKDNWVRVACVVSVGAFALAAAFGPASSSAFAFAAAYIVQTIFYAMSSNLLTAYGVRLDPSGALTAAGRGWSTLFNAAAPALGGALILWGGFTPLSFLCLAAGVTSVTFLSRSRIIDMNRNG